MKKKTFLPGILGGCGVIALLAAVVLSFAARNTSPRLVYASEDAVTLTRDFMDALREGDYTSAGAMMLGQPELDTQLSNTSQLAPVIWDAFIHSIRYEFEGEIYITDGGYAQDVTVTSLDITAVMAQLKAQSQSLLASKAETADTDAVLDENGNYREEFVMEALTEGAADLLARNPATTKRQITLSVVYRDGAWWILPDRSLLNLLAGGMM